MSRSGTFSVHAWRGIGPDVEPDLFVWRLRLGFVTVSFDKVSLLGSYRKLRETMVKRVEADESRLNEKDK